MNCTEAARLHLAPFVMAVGSLRDALAQPKSNNHRLIFAAFLLACLPASTAVADCGAIPDHVRTAAKLLRDYHTRNAGWSRYDTPSKAMEAGRLVFAHYPVRRATKDEVRRCLGPPTAEIRIANHTTAWDYKALHDGESGVWRRVVFDPEGRVADVRGLPTQ